GASSTEFREVHGDALLDLFARPPEFILEMQVGCVPDMLGFGRGDRGLLRFARSGRVLTGSLEERIEAPFLQGHRRAELTELHRRIRLQVTDAALQFGACGAELSAKCRDFGAQSSRLPAQSFVERPQDVERGKIESALVARDELGGPEERTR